MSGGFSTDQAWQLVHLAVVLAATFGGAFVLGALGGRALRALSLDLPRILLRRSRLGAALALSAIAGLLTLRALAALPGWLESGLRHGFEILLIVGCAWLARGLVRAGGDVIMERHPVDVANNFHARSLRTRVSVLERIATIVILILGVAAALMTFSQVRAVGASLLASAGIVGLVVGFAARPVLENLLAGLQIALSHPINLDDVVVIDGYWGRIEEITATYVVLEVWDERRLIMPFSRIINASFENWTRRRSEILGTVFFHADYGAPVAALREELKRICQASPLWDGRVCGLVVTDATERTLQLRALVSATDSGKAWDLRCEVREKLVDYLRREYPASLPRSRVEVAGDAPARAPMAAGK